MSAIVRLVVVFAAWFATLAVARAEVIVDLHGELDLIKRGERPAAHLASSQFVIASFAFDDPDGTGLGDALAALIGREMLLASTVTSVGLIRYEGSLQPTAQHAEGYFDKVDLVLRDQPQVSLALWGMVRRAADGVVADVYAQIPDAVVDQNFVWRLQLPDAMGGGTMVARVRPTRVLLQQLRFPSADRERIVRAATVLDELRASPRADADIVARLRAGEPHSVVSRRDGWIELAAADGQGWVPVAGGCGEACASLLEAARFGGELVRFIYRGAPPEASPAVSDDARLLAAQLAMLARLDRRGQRWPYAEANAWLARTVDGNTMARAGPASASLANIRAMAALAEALSTRVDETGETLHAVRLDPSRVQAIAFDLARASQSDPRNGDLLANLAVLFHAAGDETRAAVARDLATRAGR